MLIFPENYAVHSLGGDMYRFPCEIVDITDVARVTPQGLGVRLGNVYSSLREAISFITRCSLVFLQK